MLHYYFSDKVDLITHCVRQYKAACVTRYDEIVATATSADELRRGFGAAMAPPWGRGPLHRLWYDLRNQSLFDDSFRADVLEIDQSLQQMIWRIVSRYAELAGTRWRWPSGAAYAIFDGLFQQALLTTWPARRRGPGPGRERGARPGRPDCPLMSGPCSPDERDEPLVVRGVAAVPLTERCHQRVLLDVDAPQDDRQRQQDHGGQACQFAEARPTPMQASSNPV